MTNIKVNGYSAIYRLATYTKISDGQLPTRNNYCILKTLVNNAKTYISKYLENELDDISFAEIDKFVDGYKIIIKLFMLMYGYINRYYPDDENLSIEKNLNIIFEEKVLSKYGEVYDLSKC